MNLSCVLGAPPVRSIAPWAVTTSCEALIRLQALNGDPCTGSDVCLWTDDAQRGFLWCDVDHLRIVPMPN